MERGVVSPLSKGTVLLVRKFLFTFCLEMHYFGAFSGTSECYKITVIRPGIALECTYPV